MHLEGGKNPDAGRPRKNYFNWFLKDDAAIVGQC